MVSSRSSRRIVFAFAIALVCITTSQIQVAWSRSVEHKAEPLFRECTTHLDRTGATTLTRNEFSDLVEHVSSRYVQGPFQKLSLTFQLIFNSTACWNGRAKCIGDQASIPVATTEEQELICTTLALHLSQVMPDVTMTCSRNESAVHGHRNGESHLEPFCAMKAVEP